MTDVTEQEFWDYLANLEQTDVPYDCAGVSPGVNQYTAGGNVIAESFQGDQVTARYFRVQL